MKGKKILICLFVLLLLLNCTGCKTEEEKAAEQAKENWEKTSSEAQVGIYCALIKEYMLLLEDFGDQTPYPAMLRSVKGNMMSGGMTKSEALENAKMTILEEQAIFWYAEQNDISATQKEVETYINEYVLDEIQNQESYKAVDSICAKEGITFEDTVWAYKDSYKKNLILTQAGVNAETQDAFMNELMENYRQNESYTALMQVLDNCAELIEGNITDKEIIKSSSIYY